MKKIEPHSREVADLFDLPAFQHIRRALDEYKGRMVIPARCSACGHILVVSRPESSERIEVHCPQGCFKRYC